MDVPLENHGSLADRSSAELDAVLNALMPSTLLYVRRNLDDLDETQRKELLRDVYGPGDLDLRLANLHLVLPLLHKARGNEEKQFLLRVFLPWVGIRRQVAINRNRILDEFAKTSSFTPGTHEEYAHLVNVYRSIVADLIDPYLTLLVACYQFVEGRFTGIEAANFGQGERNKDEYLTARIMMKIPRSGYCPGIARSSAMRSRTADLTA